MKAPIDIIQGANCIDRVRAAIALFDESDKEVIESILAKYDCEIENQPIEKRLISYTKRDLGNINSAIKTVAKTLLAETKFTSDEVTKLINDAVDNTKFSEDIIIKKVAAKREDKKSWREYRETSPQRRKLTKEMIDLINMEMVREVVKQNPNLISKIK